MFCPHCNTNNPDGSAHCFNCGHDMDQTPLDPSFNESADRLIAERRLNEARALLQRAIREMPTGWKPVRNESGSLHIAFWDIGEFLAYTEGLQTSVVWIAASYSKAWYQLATIAVEEGHFGDALLCIDSGLKEEPGHPDLWCEKGYILNRLRRHEEALHCYQRAATIRDWTPKPRVARALRGQGAALIDLKRLDEAEVVFLRSLELDPDSKIAKHELEYIREQRKHQAGNKESLPWFLYAIIKPPTDPLTVELLSLVEDLESIPGPKTIGSENYSKILQAFMARGWAGFEEAFDRIVPRTRTDYADVKRSLLREPVFNRKVHRNMLRMASGDNIEDVLGDIRREKDSTKSH